MVVGVEAKAGDGVGDDALTCEGDVVGTLEELFLGVGVLHKMGTVACEFRSESGAFEAGQPKSSRRDGRVRSSDHLKLKVGDDGVEGDGRVLEECTSAEAAHLLRAKEGEDDGTGGSWAGGKKSGEGKYGSGAGGVVVGAVVDDVGRRIRWVRFCYPEVVKVGGKQDNFIGISGSAKDADGIPCFGAGGVFHAGETLLETRREGGGESALLEIGTVIATGFESEGLELRGGE